MRIEQSPIIVEQSIESLDGGDVFRHNGTDFVKCGHCCALDNPQYVYALNTRASNGFLIARFERSFMVSVVSKVKLISD